MILYFSPRSKHCEEPWFLISQSGLNFGRLKQWHALIGQLVGFTGLAFFFRVEGAVGRLLSNDGELTEHML